MQCNNPFLHSREKRTYLMLARLSSSFFSFWAPYFVLERWRSELDAGPVGRSVWFKPKGVDVIRGLRFVRLLVGSLRRCFSSSMELWSPWIQTTIATPLWGKSWRIRRVRFILLCCTMIHKAQLQERAWSFGSLVQPHGFETCTCIEWFVVWFGVVCVFSNAELKTSKCW